MRRVAALLKVVPGGTAEGRRVDGGTPGLKTRILGV